MFASLCLCVSLSSSCCILLFSLFFSRSPFILFLCSSCVHTLSLSLYLSIARAAHALVWCDRRSSTWNTIRDYSGFPQLVQHLMAADQPLQVQIAECIATVVADPANARAILDCGGHMAIAALLARPVPQLQRAAATAVSSIGRNAGPAAAAAFLEGGAVEPLAAMLRAGVASTPGSNEQLVAIDALQALATLSADPRASSVMLASCLDALFELVEKWREPGVQQQMTYLLLNLSKCSPQVRDRMVETINIGCM